VFRNLYGHWFWKMPMIIQVWFMNFLRSSFCGCAKFTCRRRQQQKEKCMQEDGTPLNLTMGIFPFFHS
jgi:hypothetical protein